ncbi:hypothetical protein KR026_000837, partial [Drosophila bipectinata]
LELYFIIQRTYFKVYAEPPRALSSLCSYLNDGKESVSNLGTTKKCFARYMPELENEGVSWSQGYSGCQKSATNERQSLLSRVSDAQEKIRKAALGLNSFIERCMAISEAVDFFNCFAKMSKEHLTTVYRISFSASEEAVILNQKLSYIQVEHYLCTNRTEYNYIKTTDQIFQSLDQCLQQNESH